METDYIFLFRLFIIGGGGGLFIMWMINTSMGLGWTLGYLFAIMFSRVHEMINAEPMTQKRGNTKR